MPHSTAEHFAVRVTRQGPVSTVAVRGDVDLATAPVLTTALDAIAAVGSTVEVDLSGTTFFGCCGLTALERAADRVRPRGGRVRVVGAASTARTVLRLSCADALVVDGAAQLG